MTRAILVGALAFVAVADSAHVKDVQEWRTKHEASYRKEYVPLAGLFFLNPGANAAGSAKGAVVALPKRAPTSIGAFVLVGDTVRFEPAGAAVMLNGKAITAPLILKDDEQDNPDELAVGDIALWVHLSGPRRTVRMRDEQGDIARTFAGFHWFPIEDSYRVTARFIKDPAPRDIHVPNIFGDDDVMTTEGVVEFMLNGQTIRLRPATTRPNRLWFVFRDGTSGKETYDTARFLYSDLNPDGTTVLDFNEAYNPPCAFNPYTTCPLPLAENRLTARILSGEKAYGAPLSRASR
jgi:uncharacterized protein (DUF1684 family)